MRRQELERELRMQQERLATLWRDQSARDADSDQAFAQAATRVREVAAQMGADGHGALPMAPNTSCASLGHHSLGSVAPSPGLPPGAMPPQPNPTASHHSLGSEYQQPYPPPGYATAPPSYAAQPLMVVRPTRRSRPSSASKRARTPTRQQTACAGSYMLQSSELSASGPHLGAPGPYDIGGAGVPLEYRAAPQHRPAPLGPGGLPGTHQQPPEILQLWMAPARKAPKRPKSPKSR